MQEKSERDINQNNSKKETNTTEKMQQSIEQSKNTKATEKSEEDKKKSKTRRWIVLAFLFIAILVAYVIYRGDYLETLELGEQYINIFWQNLSYNLITFLVNFVILFFIIYITNRKIHKGLSAFFTEENRQMPKMPNKSIAFIASIVISFFVTNMMLEKFMLCINMTGFEVTDPVFGYDIGYFIFVQPFIQFILSYLLMLVIWIMFYTAVYYILAFNFCFDGINRETLKKSKLIKQLCNDIIIIAFLLAGVIFVETFNVGLQKFLTLEGTASYSLWGAGISEVTIKMWGYRILALIIIFSIIFAVRYFGGIKLGAGGLVRAYSKAASLALNEL